MPRVLAPLTLLLAVGLGLPASGAAAATGVRPAPGRLLVATRNLLDPNFAETVVLLLRYDEEGALGVVINRPTRTKVATAVPDVKGLGKRPDVVYLGGPVLGNLVMLLVRTEKPPAGAEHVFADVYLLMSGKRVRETLAAGVPQKRLRVCAGHAGWAPGQLDAEIARGDWFVTPAETGLVFSERPETLWPSLVARGEGEWAGPIPSGLDRLASSGASSTAGVSSCTRIRTRASGAC